MRNPNQMEFVLLKRLTSECLIARDELVAQLIGLQVEELPGDRRFSLRLHPNKTAPARCNFRVPIEGRYFDSPHDKRRDPPVGVNVILHVVDGFLYYLEIYKDDDTDPLRLPAPDELELDVRQPGFNPNRPDG